MLTFNWSVPPFRTEPGALWKTQCWGPTSKTAQCDQRSQDNLTCWGEFVTKDCNNIDSVGPFNPNNISGPAAPPTYLNLTRSPYSDSAISRFAMANRPGLESDLCWKDIFASIGDGVVAGAGFPASPNNFL